MRFLARAANFFGVPNPPPVLSAAGQQSTGGSARLADQPGRATGRQDTAGSARAATVFRRAAGTQDTAGQARAAPTIGLGARGSQDTAGRATAQVLLRASGAQDTSGLARKAVQTQSARGTQDTAGRATANRNRATGSQDTTGRALARVTRAKSQDTAGLARVRIIAFGTQDTLGSASQGGINTSYQYSTTFVLAAQSDLPAQTINNYVLRTHLEGTWLKKQPTGRLFSSVGWDLIFETLDNPPVRLDHELEAYDGTAGTLDVNVRVPSYRTDQQYIFRARYGSSSFS